MGIYKKRDWSKCGLNLQDSRFFRKKKLIGISLLLPFLSPSLLPSFSFDKGLLCSSDFVHQAGLELTEPFLPLLLPLGVKMYHNAQQSLFSY